MKKTSINDWYGWTPDRPDHRDKMFATLIALQPLTLPSSVDLRDKCPPVEDQGQLGSCTANALVSNLEFLQLKINGKVTDLSRLFVYYNERVIEGTIHDDAGAMLRDGIKTLAKQGVCVEAKWSYVISKFARKPTVACYKAAAAHKILSYHRILNLQEMKHCLADGFPFVFGFTVYDEFEADEMSKSGQLGLPSASSSALGGHAVCAVGYDDAVGRFIIRNSWGADWGTRGYFTMPYEYVSNPNLADDFWTIRA